MKWGIRSHFPQLYEHRQDLAAFGDSHSDHWHATCNRHRSREPAKGRDVGNNLSVCESKQTVAAVWRPKPVTGYCTFHITRENGCRESGAGFRRWSPKAGSVRVQLGRDVCPARLAGRMKPQGVAIPAIRRLSRMMPCLSRGRPPQTEGPVGYASQRQPGLYFARSICSPRTSAGRHFSQQPVAHGRRQLRDGEEQTCASRND